MRKLLTVWISCVLMSGIWITVAYAHVTHLNRDQHGAVNHGAFTVRILHVSHPIVGE